MAQLLRPYTSTAGGVGSIPGGGTKQLRSHMLHSAARKKKWISELKDDKKSDFFLFMFSNSKWTQHMEKLFMLLSFITIPDSQPPCFYKTLS